MLTIAPGRNPRARPVPHVWGVELRPHSKNHRMSNIGRKLDCAEDCLLRVYYPKLCCWQNEPKFDSPFKDVRRTLRGLRASFPAPDGNHREQFSTEGRGVHRRERRRPGAAIVEAATKESLGPGARATRLLWGPTAHALVEIESERRSKPRQLLIMNSYQRRPVQLLSRE
jgi:hypothetical protein